MKFQRKKAGYFIKQRGFALISTILIMSLLLLVALAMLQLAPVTQKGAQQGKAKAEAEANARLALMIAIGELQEQAGPDQRITASANIKSDNTVNPHWTGVWSTENGSSLPVWLVSGNERFDTRSLADFDTYPAGYPKTCSSKNNLCINIQI